MDRWSGVLKIPLIANTRNYYRVAASLCLSSSSTSSSSQILAVPSANAIFFHGDRVQDTGNHVIERLYDLQKVAEIIVSKFGNSINAWVVEASVFNGAFAIYKDFVPSVNQWGAPISYSPNGFPSSSTIVSLLSSCLQEAKKLILKEGKELCMMNQIASVHHCPKTIVLGFSKGGVVINQLMSEISSLDTNLTKSPSSAMVEEPTSQYEMNQIIPASKESFLNSVSEVHYIDVGLNSCGAYITDQNIVRRISQRLAQDANSIRIVIHGTPRQWCDEQRGWILKEKDELVRLLKSEAENCNGKLVVHERFYFSDRLPDLQMHFEIIDALDVLYGRLPPAIIRFERGSTTVADLETALLDRDAMLDRIKYHLARAQSLMKQSADKHRRDVQFEVGSLVFLKLRPYRQASVIKRLCQKLAARYYGPFQVIARIGKVAYRLQLPESSKIHNVFHVSQLKEAVGQHLVHPLPTTLSSSDEFVIEPEAILDSRYNASGYLEALVKWKGVSSEENTWVIVKDLISQFPLFKLGDKLVAEGGSIDRPLQVYVRRNKQSQEKNKITETLMHTRTAEQSTDVAAEVEQKDEGAAIVLELTDRMEMDEDGDRNGKIFTRELAVNPYKSIKQDQRED